MAISLDGNGSMYHASVPFSGVPGSIFARFNQDSDEATRTLATISDFSDFNDYFSLGMSANKDTLAVHRAGPSRSASTTGGANEFGQWLNALAVLTGLSDRDAYRTGLSPANNTGTAGTNPVDLDRLGIGSQQISSTYAERVTGDIADVAFWNVALDAADWAILDAGYSPLFVKPSGLVNYFPLIRNYRCLITGVTLSTEGTGHAWAAHPPVIYPGYQMVTVNVPVVASTRRIFITQS